MGKHRQQDKRVTRRFNDHDEDDGYAAGGWIKGAIKHRGALHEELGVPAGKKIPASALAKAAKQPGKLGQRARLAETLKGFKK